MNKMFIKTNVKPLSNNVPIIIISEFIIIKATYLLFILSKVNIIAFYFVLLCNILRRKMNTELNTILL